LNISVQYVYNLGWKLAAVLDCASERLLDIYEEQRRSIAAQILAWRPTSILGGASRIAVKGARGETGQET
jgi:2-polyprenyl-6-methoxyphenol hydroxylase-like FAD-dependent oxidoreductase